MYGFRKLFAVAVAAFVLVHVTHSHAALVGWTDDTYLTDGTEDGTGVILDSTGGWTYVDAWNAGGPDVTVNGVAFKGTPTNISQVGASVDILAQNPGEFTGTFQTLMETLKANTANGTSWTITMSGLTIGQTYRAQFLDYQGFVPAGIRDMEIHFGSDGTGPGTGDFSAAEALTGHSWTAEFTADAATQNFFIRAGGSDRSIVNAVSLFTQVVPTPAALPAGLALLALTVLRKRRS